MGIKSETTKMSYNLPLERKFLFPHGHCMKMVDVNSKPIVGLRTNAKVTIYFVDPAKLNDIRTGETYHAQATIGPANDNLFERQVYEVSYSVHDATIHDGITCTDYTKTKSSYGRCLMDVLTDELLQGYGCMPPWVHGNYTDQVCGEAMHINVNDVKDKSIFFDLNELLGNREVDMFKQCLPPCITTRIELERVLYKSNKIGNAFLLAKSNDWATVSTETYSYDIFSLTVDFGSALGLWLGLSCISILDLVLVHTLSMKRFFIPKTKLEPVE